MNKNICSRILSQFLCLISCSFCPATACNGGGDLPLTDRPLSRAGQKKTTKVNHWLNSVNPIPHEGGGQNGTPPINLPKSAGKWKL